MRAAVAVVMISAATALLATKAAAVSRAPVTTGKTLRRSAATSLSFAAASQRAPSPPRSSRSHLAFAADAARPLPLSSRRPARGLGLISSHSTRSLSYRGVVRKNQGKAAVWRVRSVGVGGRRRGGTSIFLGTAADAGEGWATNKTAPVENNGEEEEDGDDDDDPSSFLDEEFPSEETAFVSGAKGDMSAPPITDEDEDDELAHLQQGIPGSFRIIKYYTTPPGGFDLSAESWALGKDGPLSQEIVDRLSLTAGNVSLPVALMMLDPEEYPSQSRARKACRRQHALVHRGTLDPDAETGRTELFDLDRCEKGLVATRVHPGDVVARQVRMTGGFYPTVIGGDIHPPPFDLPVLYEDDHFAIVNKPPGVVVHSQRGGGHGRMTVRSALPFALSRPRTGTLSILRRPQPVHRLDKPTSGLLLVAKTKPAMTDLSRQFVERIVKKSYMAVVNGIPLEDRSTLISSAEARALGVDVSPDDDDTWRLTDLPLQGRDGVTKSAVTVWRPIRNAPSSRASDGILTLVELKPKTGRYHQLRRHMAWACDRPLVGDTTYSPDVHFTERGLFLCSNRVSLEHPYYNSPSGREEWEEKKGELLKEGSPVCLSEDGTIFVKISIDLPNKFQSILDREEERTGKCQEQVDGGLI